MPNGDTNQGDPSLRSAMRKFVLGNAILLAIFATCCGLLLSYFFDLTTPKDYAAWITASICTAMCPLLMLDAVLVAAKIVIPILTESLANKDQGRAFMNSSSRAAQHNSDS